MALLVDGAPFFRAVREAILKARRSVFIIGWDLHSQTRLVGETCQADDGYPVMLADFLSAVVRERPKLVVRLLLWDYSVLYANERELFPRLTLGWNTPDRVCFALDDAVPFGSSQHQKLVVVDDCVAFSGGLDLTIRRWDTSEHAVDNPHRADPSGKPYRPFHDVQAAVQGPAARALGGIARARWMCVTGERIQAVKYPAGAWPDSVVPDFTDVDVGIARTQPRYDGQEEVREAERLFLDSITAAERFIYIENQFFTSVKVADTLSRRLRERPELEVLMVAPQHHHSWLEAHTMRTGRIRFMQVLRDAGVADRVRLVYPEVTNGQETTDTMIHSKVMVIDDRLLRIGSANLNNRSMGTDTECDLAIEAASADQRRTVVRIRDRLVAEHCGVAPEEVSVVVGETGSLLAAAERLSDNGHRLRPVEDGELQPGDLATQYIESVADPEQPIGADAFLEAVFGSRHRRRGPVLKLVLVALVIVGLALAWHTTPLAQLAEPDAVRGSLAAFAQNPWAPALVVLTFVAAGFVAFPVTMLIAATAAAFGPLPGLVYATAGVLASATITYAVGARLGKEALRNVLGPRLNRIRRKIARQGVLAVATIRLVPLAPFTVVNLVAGASAIRPIDFLAGTVLGMLPGLIVLSVLGHQIVRILADPSPAEIALLVAAVAAWIAVSVGLQFIVSRAYSSERLPRTGPGTDTGSRQAMRQTKK
ncbi:MAG: VTT domain-containing protein [Xanthobacteraceae bacterium]